jgi:hypothetical protein
VPEATVRKILYPLTAAIILAYFLFFTWKGVLLYFDADDMMNLYKAWSQPLGELLRANIVFWKGFYRPLGWTFYRGVFALAGFNPVPFHIAALGLGVLNLGLTFWFTRLVSGSERIAALATLIFAFHTRLMEVWFRTAVVYDVLCFTFTYLAACLYIGARREGRELSAGRIASILVCFILALGAKEMAVCLPFLLAAWELLWSGKPRGVPRRAISLIAAFVFMTVLYAIGKLRGPDSMVNNPAYTPEYSWTRFTQNWSVYLGHLVAGEHDPKAWISMTIVAGLLAVAVVWRSRPLILAWVVIFFGSLPVSFSPPRGAFVIYISWVGWALYAAFLLVALQDLVTRARPQYRTALACFVFVLVGWRFGKFNLHDQRADPRAWLHDSPNAVHSMADQMLALHSAFPSKAHILFVDDSFPNTEWTPVFIVELLYRDPGLTVDRMKMMTARPANWDDYQYVFTYEGTKYRQLKPM